MKVLVVDDEYYARKAVLKILKEWDTAVEILGDVESGAEAIEIIRRDAPDLLIADVRMAGVDGIELCKYTKENNPNIQIFIVSGYADFEYAQQAINFNVRKYFLKPLDPEEFKSSLDEVRKLKGSLDTEYRAIKSEIDRLRKIRMVMGLISGRNTELEDSVELLRLAEELMEYYTVVFQSHKKLNSGQRDLVIRDLEKLFDDKAFIFSNEIGRNEIVCLVHASEQREFITSNNTFVLLDNFSKRLIGILKHSFSIGISSKKNNISVLMRAYEEARYAINGRLINQADRVYEYTRAVKSFNAQSETSFEFDNEKERLLLQLILKRREKQANELIRSTFDNLKSTKASVLKIREIFIKIVGVINEAIIETKSGKDTICDNHSILSSGSIENFFSMDEIVEYLCCNITSICSTENEVCCNENDMVLQILKIVEESYYSELTLEGLAKNQLFVNSSYLSRLIKHSTGKSFSQLLMDTRMEKARKLLADTDLNVNEVAYLIGYNKVSHFISLYKRYYGDTPGNQKLKSITQ